MDRGSGTHSIPEYPRFLLQVIFTPRDGGLGHMTGISIWIKSLPYPDARNLSTCRERGCGQIRPTHGRFRNLLMGASLPRRLLFRVSRRHFQILLKEVRKVCDTLSIQVLWEGANIISLVSFFFWQKLNWVVSHTFGLLWVLWSMHLLAFHDPFPRGPFFHGTFSYDYLKLNFFG